MHSLQIRQEGEGGPERDSERQNLDFTQAAGEECGFRWCQALLGSLGWEHSSGVMGRSAEPGLMGKVTESGLAWPLRFSATTLMSFFGSLACTGWASWASGMGQEPTPA